MSWLIVGIVRMFASTRPSKDARRRPLGREERALYLSPPFCQGRRMALVPPIDAPAATVRQALAPLRNDFSVALAAPGNAFAIGAVIRVAHSFLAREVFVVGEGDWYRKAAMGMHKYENVVQVRSSDELLDRAA